MSLLQFEDDIMPFTFADANLNWSFKSQVIKFVKRFFKDPYRDEDTVWIKKFAVENNIKRKLMALSRLL